jgi:hypothetical protein
MMMKSVRKHLCVVAIPLLLLAVPTIAVAQSVPGFTVMTFATGITGAREVSTDPAGNVYSMGRDSGIVYEMSRTGAVSVVANLGAGYYIGPYFDRVSGDLFAATCWGVDSILRINSSGSVSAFVSGLTCPSGFASDASGNIYASEFSSPGRVVKITPGGIVSTYATGLSLPDGIGFGPQGELYVGNRGTNQVMRVPPGGGAATVFASGFTVPIDVVADNRGNVYVANFWTGTISTTSPAGTVSTFGTGFGTPIGLAFDRSGSLFIADFWTGVIYKVAGVSPDADGDGIPDSEDACPNSDLRATAIIEDCDSGLANVLFTNGCTISDLITQCADGVNNHGEFVSCVADLTKNLNGAGTITGRQKGAIQHCAAKTHIR